MRAGRASGARKEKNGVGGGHVKIFNHAVFASAHQSCQDYFSRPTNFPAGLSQEALCRPLDRGERDQGEKELALLTGLQFAPGIGLRCQKNMSPLVSIIIPTFDRPAYLKDAVRSALGQTYPNVEVVIGDNGADDVMRGWESSLVTDPRLTYRRNPRNLGMPGNFNALADAARGEFLVAIGDDDRLLPEFVSRLMQEMKPGVSLVFANHYLIDSDGARLESQSYAQTRRYNRDKLPTGPLPDSRIAAWQQAVAISATLMRTADMQRLRFREDLNAPDAEYFIRLAHEGATFAFVPDYLVEYRVHLGAESSSGVQSERLVEYLLPLDVSPELESYKKQLLGPLMMNAVSRCLRQGETAHARKLLRSPYYPRRVPTHGKSTRGLRNFVSAAEHAVKLGLQHLCASLPAPIGCPAYRAVRSAKDWAKSGS